MNKSGLVFRLALAIICTAIIAGLLITKFFYHYTFQHQQTLGTESIKQLVQTVTPTASIASYLGDEELIKEVINGLVSNDIVTSVAIKTDLTLIKSRSFNSSERPLEFTLYSPFQTNRQVGMLYVIKNDSYLQQQAKKISLSNSFFIAIEALIITLISIFVTHYLITRPILNISDRLHLLNPGTKDRVDKPTSHQHSEIGQLSDDINALLNKTEQQIIQEKNLRNEVQVLESKFRMLFEHATSAMVLMNATGDILLFNESFEKLITKLNLEVKRNYGKYLQDLFIHKAELHDHIAIAFANGESATIELELHTNKRENIWMQVAITPLISDELQENFQVTLHDISKRKQQIALLDQQANYDGLTRLLNRHAAEQHLKRLTMQEEPFAFIMLDLNGFKPINDTYGHDAGDELLVHVSEQLTNSLRKNDVLSRWGGDEFVIVLPHTTKDDVVKLCAKLAQNIKKPRYLSQYDKAVSVSASMGVSFYPNDKNKLDELIRVADKAMYEAKKSKAKNENNYISFSSDIPNKT